MYLDENVTVTSRHSSITTGVTCTIDIYIYNLSHNYANTCHPIMRKLLALLLSLSILIIHMCHGDHAKRNKNDISPISFNGLIEMAISSQYVTVTSSIFLHLLVDYIYTNNSIYRSQTILIKYSQLMTYVLSHCIEKKRESPQRTSSKSFVYLTLIVTVKNRCLFMNYFTDSHLFIEYTRSSSVHLKAMLFEILKSNFFNRKIETP